MGEQCERCDTDELVKRLRRAFDADSVAEKNLAIRAAFDFIAALQPEATPVAHCGDLGAPLCPSCSVSIVELTQQPLGLAQARKNSVDSILERARREGAELAHQQSSMAEYDRGYLNGQSDMHRSGHINEGRWFRFGVLCGIALSVLVWSFWP